MCVPVFSQGPPDSAQPTYKEDGFTQVTFNIGGDFAFFLKGIGANVGVGVSLPDNGDWSRTQVFLTTSQYDIKGFGVYAGVGASLGLSHSNGPLPDSDPANGAPQTQGYQQGEAGWVESVGLASANDGSTSVSVLPKLGAGYGGFYGKGTVTTWTHVITNDDIGPLN